MWAGSEKNSPICKITLFFIVKYPNTIFSVYIYNQYPWKISRDVKQVYPSRSVLYRGELVVERVTAGLSRAGCGLQNVGPNPYRRIYRPSWAIPRDAYLSNRLLQLLS
ncbi:hypothetical protein IGI04_029834 [Brassica rapa subsp. trilocularis]|uniref:Uncharacterized protein n=1 Tax=Brassica rapa subsp. trilocularis TaxID=1813537 RepID=A0ABQ7LNY1_BRACM|nr:hypothetical protein IGI04_029834 [Brassica rapa subsp. trilocularis]